MRFLLPSWEEAEVILGSLGLEGERKSWAWEGSVRRRQERWASWVLTGAFWVTMPFSFAL